MLDQAEFVLNTRFHEAIQETPFFMMHGYHPWKGDERVSQKSPGATEWQKIDRSPEESRNSNGKSQCYDHLQLGL